MGSKGNMVRFINYKMKVVLQDGKILLYFFFFVFLSQAGIWLVL